MSTTGIHRKRSVASRFACIMDYHVWGPMLETYHKLHPQPKSITELKEALQMIWDRLPQESINEAVRRFTLRMKRCTKAGSKHSEDIKRPSNMT